MRVFILIAALFLFGCSNLEAEPTHESVIKIFADNGRVYCSAVVISETQIATAKHCTAHGNVRVPGMRITNIHESAEHDVAVIEVESTLDHARAEIAPYLPEHGEPITLVGFGNACGGFGEREHVMLSAQQGWLKSEGEACGGDSGGGLFNAQGELVSIHSGRYEPGRAESTDAAVLHGI